MPHLWEIKHPYYCTEGTSDTDSEYSSLAYFLEEWGAADNDYNLLFRWDWQEKDEEGEPLPEGVGILKLFYVLQRKGRLQSCRVTVNRTDEPAIIEFLRPRLTYLLRLWEPLLDAPQPATRPAGEGSE